MVRSKVKGIENLSFEVDGAHKSLMYSLTKTM